MSEYTIDLTGGDYEQCPPKMESYVPDALPYAYSCNRQNENHTLNHVKLLNKVKSKLTGSAEVLIVSKEVNSILTYDPIIIPIRRF